MRTSILSLVGISLLAGVAHGQSSDRLDELARRMPGVAPEPGRDKAPVRPAPWCEAVTLNEGSSSPLSVAAAFEQWKTDGFLSLIKAARFSCLYTKTPAGQVASTMIEQTWINLTGLGEADAVESITARVRGDLWEADHRKLCDALADPGEALGEDAAFRGARRVLFGCPGIAQWGEQVQPPDELLAFLDQSDVPADELVRVSRILGQTSTARNATNADHLIASYVVDAYDFRALSSAAALKLLDAPPYAGNRYARVIAKESIARARLAIAAVEQDVKKRIGDADWKELLVGAPQRAIEAYTAAATKYRAELARSNAFEHKVLGPRKSAGAGCEAELRKDFVTVYKALPHANVGEARNSLSDPIAALLFNRLLVCMSVDGNEEIASELRRNLREDVRIVRGPRIAAYYGAIEALGKLLADRERFPVKPVDLQWVFGRQDVLEPLAPNKRTGFDTEQSGVVKSVNKIAGGLHVTFVAAQHQEMSRSCVNTNRIVQIRSDGTIQYYQSCRDTGLVTVHDTPEEITIPAVLADGVAPGCAIEFGVTAGHKLERVAVPRAVYADKTKKKLIGYHGFAF